MLSRKVLLVEAMARFVKDAEECFVEESRIVARRDAAIAGARARTERVRGSIETAPIKVEPNRRRCGFSEDLLAIDREFPMGQVAIGVPAGGHHRFDQWDQISCESSK